eukprot:1835481-Rhodomonas_salina.2
MVRNESQLPGSSAQFARAPTSLAWYDPPVLLHGRCYRTTRPLSCYTAATIILRATAIMLRAAAAIMLHAAAAIVLRGPTYQAAIVLRGRYGAAWACLFVPGGVLPVLPSGMFVPKGVLPDCTDVRQRATSGTEAGFTCTRGRLVVLTLGILVPEGVLPNWHGDVAKYVEDLKDVLRTLLSKPPLPNPLCLPPSLLPSLSPFIPSSPSLPR